MFMLLAIQYAVTFTTVYQIIYIYVWHFCSTPAYYLRICSLECQRIVPHHITHTHTRWIQLTGNTLCEILISPFQVYITLILLPTWSRMTYVSSFCVPQCNGYIIYIGGKFSRTSLLKVHVVVYFWDMFEASLEYVSHWILGRHMEWEKMLWKYT